MKLKTQSFIEHRAVGEQFGVYGHKLRPNFILPGACTSCNGSSCCSCCVFDRPQTVVARTFIQAAAVQARVVHATRGG